MKNRLLATLLGVLFVIFSFDARVSGQSKTTEHFNPNTSTIALGVKDERADYLLKSRTTIYLKDGSSMQGTLLQNVPENPNNILIEVNGKVIDVNFSEVKYMEGNPRLIDEFSKVRFNDALARTDSFFIEMNNDPNAQGQIIYYGTTSSDAKAFMSALSRRPAFARRNSPRVRIINGGCAPSFLIQLWVIPAGAGYPPREQTRRCPR